jgi:hypothetical protein
MERKISVGDKEMSFKASAATNILYKKAFHDDILVKLTSYSKNLKELQKIQETFKELKEDTSKSDEERLAVMTELMNSEVVTSSQTFSSETLPKLAYIMYLEANEKVGEVFKKLNEESYMAWLMEIDQDELVEVTGQVMDIWQSGARQHSKPKN